MRQITDEAGLVILAEAYDPYGNPTVSVGTAQTNYGFTAEQTDPTGMIYLRARYYAPEMGRFMSRDTWGGDQNQPMSFNRWNYTEGNPINYFDPTGHIVWPNEMESADKIVESLRQYDVNIVPDWEVPLTTDFQFTHCSWNWQPGLFSMTDLLAIESAIHILYQGITALGGSYYGLYRPFEVHPIKGGQMGTYASFMTYDVTRPDKVRSVIHEMGHRVHVLANDEPARRFRDDMKAYCYYFDPGNGEKVKTDELCGSKFSSDPTKPRRFYDPGPYAGPLDPATGIYPYMANDHTNIPNYAQHGPAEDFAETFVVVVTRYYLYSSGDGIYLSDAAETYNRYNHSLWKRGEEMEKIIRGQ